MRSIAEALIHWLVVPTLFIGWIAWPTEIIASSCVTPGSGPCPERRQNEGNSRDESNDRNNSSDREEEEHSYPPGPCSYCAALCDRNCPTGTQTGSNGLPIFVCSDTNCCERELKCFQECYECCETDTEENCTTRIRNGADSPSSSIDTTPRIDTDSIRVADEEQTDGSCDFGEDPSSDGDRSSGRRRPGSFVFDWGSLQPSWPDYGDGDPDESAIPPRVMWVNSGTTLLLWHFTDSGRGIISDIKGDRLCRATVRYQDPATGRTVVRQRNSVRKKFTIGGTWNQQRFNILAGTKKAIRHLYEFEIGVPDTAVEYIVGCEPDSVGRVGDWSEMGHATIRSPNYRREQDKEITFIAVADLWSKNSSDLLGPGGGRFDDITAKWVHDSMYRNYFGPRPAGNRQAQLVIKPGDVSNEYGCALEYYEAILPIYSDIASLWPIYTVEGNHDYYCDEGYSHHKMILNPAHRSSYRHDLGEPAGDNFERSFYHVNYGRLHLIGLNIPLETYDPDAHDGVMKHAGMVRSGNPQYEWLKDTLEAIPAEDVKVLFYHAPVTCTDESRTDFCRLLQTHNVDLVINGHWEAKDPYITSIQTDPEGTPRAVPQVVLPSGGSCPLGAQEEGGPRCNNTAHVNKLGYLAAHYLPGRRRMEIETISVNQERSSGVSPTFSHRWIYDLETRRLTREY